MRQVTLEELLEAGCHFGHQVTRSNPKARDFIYEVRDNIHIIDLAKTKEGLEEAAAFVKDLASKNGKLLVIGTKRQAKGIVEEEVKKSPDIFYVTNHWVGGLLTNFSEVSKNFEKLKTFTENLKNEELKSKYTKKEIGQWFKEKQKLESIYGGVAEIKDKPDAIFVIDSHLENLAIREAKRMGVATVAMVDTNADPNIVDYPIPANDDAVGSIKLIVSYIVDAWVEGRKPEERAKETKEIKVSNEKNKEKSTKKTRASVKNNALKEKKEEENVKRKPRTT
ncbi:MAG: ribosomal protein S2 [uncultured bacterium]|nr:MAG: ribosomal protein S2 [uncultured bacterium]OGH13257.1 MAG: 30S ribosomal protein S2 [Candidatus Levybacteria bacterium RIFCSPHIGHO2_01_FULL_38_26]